jgi:hypothetical protein
MGPTADRRRDTARLRTLWRHRRLVGAALVLSIVGFVVVSFRISFPATLQSRGYQVGTATAIVLVDAPRSGIVDVRAGTRISVLAYRAALLAELTMEPVIMDELPRRLGVPRSLVVPDPPRATAVATGASVTPDDRRAYVVRGQAPKVKGGDSPIITISTRAPTPDAAAALADAAVAALDQHLARVNRANSTPVGRRIQLTLLAPSDGTPLQRGPRPALAAAAAGAAFALVCWSIAGLAARWRRLPEPLGA